MSFLETFNTIRPIVVQRAFDGWQLLFEFENGYGASVIEHKRSCGVELAVLHGEKIMYDTPITDDVVRIHDELDLIHHLQMIRDLPTRKDA